MTFTRYAAMELHERLVSALGHDASHIRVETFHSLWLGIVRNHHLDFGYPSEEIEMIDAEQQKELVKEVCGEMRGKVPYTKVLAAMEHYASAGHQGADREDIAVAVGRYMNELRLRACVCYSTIGILIAQTLARAGATSAAGLLTTGIPREGNARSAEILNLWRRHWFVDEFQDVNRVQHDFLIAQGWFPRGARTMLVVGDVDQTIYRWRGADPSLMGTFPNDDSATLALRRNHRSLQRIVDVATGFICGGGHQMRSRIAAARGEGGVVQILRPWTWPNEIPDDGAIAVLCRTNEACRLAASELAAALVPHTVIGAADRVLRDPAAKEIISYLAMPECPRSASHARRICKAEGLSDITYHRVLAEAKTSGYTVFEVLQDEGESLCGFYDDLAKETSMLERLIMCIERYEMNRPALEPRVRHALRQMITAYVRETKWASRTGLGFSSWLALRDSQTDFGSHVERVQVMTMHSAKGLEFDHVVIFGLDASFPRANDDEAMQDERRLMYVAMTRAKDGLHLVSDSTAPSPFVSDIAALLADGGAAVA